MYMYSVQYVPGTTCTVTCIHLTADPTEIAVPSSDYSGLFFQVSCICSDGSEGECSPSENDEPEQEKWLEEYEDDEEEYKPNCEGEDDYDDDELEYYDEDELSKRYTQILYIYGYVYFPTSFLMQNNGDIINCRILFEGCVWLFVYLRRSI